jgi:hypothetical protein
MGCDREGVVHPKDTVMTEGSRIAEDVHAAHYAILQEYKKRNGIQLRHTTYDVDDAIDLLDTTMNSLYCRPEGQYEETLVFADTFTVSHSSEQINEEDLNDLMDSIALFAGGHYYAESRNTKEEFLFDHVHTSTSSTTELEISAYFYMRAGDPVDESDTYPYSYKWPYGMGDEIECEGNSNEDELNAAVLFARDLRENEAYEIVPPNVFFFIDPYTICFSPLPTCAGVGIPSGGFIDETLFSAEVENGDDPTPEDNFFEYLLWYNNDGDNNYHECLSTNEMDFYYEEMADLLDKEKPANKVLTSIEVGYREVTVFDNIIFHVMHGVYLSTGVPWETEKQFLPNPN